MKGFKNFHWGLLDKDQFLMMMVYVNKKIFIKIDFIYPLAPLSSMRFGSRANIQSIKSPWPILHSQFKPSLLTPLEGNNNGRKTNINLYYIYKNI